MLFNFFYSFRFLTFFYFLCLVAKLEIGCLSAWLLLLGRIEVEVENAEMEKVLHFLTRSEKKSLGWDRSGNW